MEKTLKSMQKTNLSWHKSGIISLAEGTRMQDFFQRISNRGILKSFVFY